MTPRDLRKFCRVSDGADSLLKTVITRLRLSARAYHRVLKIARTIADLAGAAEIEPAHVSEAGRNAVLHGLLPLLRLELHRIQRTSNVLTGGAELGHSRSVGTLRPSDPAGQRASTPGFEALVGH